MVDWQVFWVSTSFVVISGMLESLVAPERAAGLPYFIKTGIAVDWQWVFVVGILLGSFLSAKLFGDFRWQAVGALWGIIGMLVGAALFAEAYPFLKRTVLTWGNLGKLTVPQVLGVNHWPVIAVMIIGTLVLFYWFEKKGL